MRIIVSLTPDEANRLRRGLSGQGGFQSLINSLQNKLYGDDLEMDLEDVERIARYVKEYGTGGFQGRLEGIINAIQRLVTALRSLT